MSNRKVCHLAKIYIFLEHRTHEPLVIPNSEQIIHLEYNTGSCNENQKVMVKVSSSYGISKLNIARISSKYAM